jgi:hypothetical protein
MAPLFLGLGTARCETRTSIPAEQLDRAIEQVLEQREFTWRMPREKQEKEEAEIKGPVATVMEWILDAVGTGFRSVAGWIKAFFGWLRDLLPKPRPLPEGSKSGPGWIPSSRTLLIGLLVLLVCALLFFVVRTLLIRKHRLGLAPAEPVPIIPDLNDEDVSAADLPQDRWISLARELMEKGSLREALRAMYLGTLAGLAEKGVITLAKHKSNRDYKDEVRRRAHGNTELHGLFAASVALFDRTWYGRFTPTPDDLQRFAQDHKRISSVVQV